MSLVADILGLWQRLTPSITTSRVPVPLGTDIVTYETVDIAKAREASAAAATPAELQLSNEAMQLIERDEGDRLTAYQDVVGVWTIGYGHTGPDVTPGLTITEAAAQALLAGDLHKFEDGVSDAVAGGATTGDNQFSAMVSFAYNVGLGGLHGSSVLRFHRAGQYAQAADAFLLWDKAGGQVYPGLVRRRHQERELYLGLTVDP